MKYLKLMIIAIVAIFSFSAADAQIRVKIGDSHPHRRVVVVHHYRHRRHVVIVHHR